MAADPGNYPGMGSPGQGGKEGAASPKVAALGPLYAEVSLVECWVV